MARSSTAHSLLPTSSSVSFDKSWITSIATATYERCFRTTRSSFWTTCCSLITSPKSAKLGDKAAETHGEIQFHLP
jgi:hypothetical protein